MTFMSAGASAFVQCSQRSSKTASMYFDWLKRGPYGLIVQLCLLSERFWSL